ncbi:c-type cytochrome biogenesis protein CcmI [Pseudovibrio sp. SPO723]|uniref:c-type cytochrome biogenesis protein CcmI n=1 Tax=Nesiotobacter zosterae TaxID=392721 RepID=UPI0029C2CE89|nr:c-type cytochrome biogenesis protein CcmI [Pseudovibrio sp. SPO723]MDX5595573.1 c-type cytochrome biogenesis protein CcmI [Pseudovibrio sp. SPO723]
MMFWIVLALMTAAVSLSVLVAVSRSRNKPEREDNDVLVFRQQLTEVEDDARTGAISPEMAEAARTEISRRLLAASRQAEQRAKQSISPASAIWVRLAIIVFLPLSALALYFYVGAPGVPDQPLAERLAQIQREPNLEQLITRTEEHLVANPDDAQGWLVLAPVYSRIGAYDKAQAAYGEAIRIIGPNPELELARAENMIFAAQGQISAEAEAMMQRASAAAPDQIKPKFYLALALGQRQENEAAIAAWTALLEEADENEPWVPVAQAQLNELRGQTNEPQSSAVAIAPAPQEGADTLSGPSAEEIAAAQEMTAEDRQAMIRGMVEGLELRLTEDGGSAAEWGRLVRSLIVIGEEGKAQEMLLAAREDLKADQGGLEQLDALALTLGLN